MHNLLGDYFFEFTDVYYPPNTTHWARANIFENVRYGLMHGRVADYDRTPGPSYHGSQDEFLPDNPMWRLEFAMALGRLHELNGGNIDWAVARVMSPFYDININSRFPYNYDRLCSLGFSQ